MAAPPDEALDRVAHRAGPVLVVADRQVQRVPVRTRTGQQLGVVLQIGVGDHVDLVALPFGPLEERQLPVGPARRAGVGREVVRRQVAAVRGHLRVGHLHGGDPPPGPGRLGQVAGRQRALERHRGAAGVEVPAAEVVVGVPGVGRHGEQRRCGRGADLRPHHEEGVAPPGVTIDVDLQDDLVVPAPPRRVDVEHHGRRPAAALPVGAAGRGVVIGRECRLGEHHLTPPPHPGHLDRHRPPAGRRQVQPHGPPAHRRLRPAIPSHRLIGHRRKLLRPVAVGRPPPPEAAEPRSPTHAQPPTSTKARGGPGPLRWGKRERIQSA